MPTELPTVSRYGSSGKPNLHGKIPMGSPRRCLLSCPFLHIWKQGLCTELPTELPTVSIYGSSGQPNLHGKIPIGSPRAAHSVSNVQPMGSDVGSSLFVPYGHLFVVNFVHTTGYIITHFIHMRNIKIFIMILEGLDKKYFNFYSP